METLILANSIHSIWPASAPWAKGPSLDCQCHSLIHEEVWGTRSATGNLKGWLANRWGVCDAEGQRPNSPETKNTLAPRWKEGSKWKFTSLTGWRAPKWKLRNTGALNYDTLSSENHKTSSQGAHTWPDSINFPRLKAFHSVIQNHCLRTYCVASAEQSRMSYDPCAHPYHRMTE